ncbi:hypothetical protein [Nonomuraea sp. NPDC001023]|uniref:hypothetical protein n=1 Tax=Nonomuraea sp. NPDC001023 TaxID=3154770 RepID=UPI0033224799
MITSEPTLAAGSVALRRATARSIEGPLGWAQSMGTVSLPHSALGSSSQGAQVMAFVVVVAGFAVVAALAAGTGIKVASATKAVANSGSLLRKIGLQSTAGAPPVGIRPSLIIAVYGWK